MDTADAPADLQAHFVSALYSTGTIGTYVHGNLHTVYASSSLAQPCITIFPKKRFGCSVCPLNPKSDDGLRACGDGYVNVVPHGQSHSSGLVPRAGARAALRRGGVRYLHRGQPAPPQV